MATIAGLMAGGGGGGGGGGGSGAGAAGSGAGNPEVVLDFKNCVLYVAT